MPRQLFTSGIAVSSNQPEIRKRYNVQNEPYVDTAEVFADNDPNTFYLGQTFFISDGRGGIEEFWFESAVNSASDLRPKEPNAVRMADSLDSLRAMENLRIGEYVRTYGYHAGSDMGGGLFKVTTDEPVDFVSLNANPPSLENIHVLGTTITANSRFKMKFKLDGLSTTVGTVQLMIVEDLPYRFSINVEDKGTNGYNISTPSTVMVLRDEFGNLLDSKAFLSYGAWYEVDALVEQANTFPFSGTLFIGTNAGQYTKADIEWFEINGILFPLNEGSGNTISGNDPSATQGTISTGATWGTGSATDDGALHITTSTGEGLTKQLPNNTVTPFDYGAISNEFVTDYINDSRQAIQDAIDSGYDVDIPPSRLYITESLNIEASVQIRMHGSFMPQGDQGHEVTISDEAHTTTILYSNQNIDYIVVKSRNVKIYNGLLYTAGSVDHSMSGIRFDTNYPIWRTDVVGVGVFGNIADLVNPDKVGTTAFKIDSENLENGGYLTEGRIDGRAYYCYKGVEVTPLDTSTDVFVNNIDFTVTGEGCQVYYDFAFGDLFTVTSVGQDANVLPPYVPGPGVLNPIEDPKYTAFQFHNCSFCTFDVFLFDPVGIGGHHSNVYAISGESITIKGRLLESYTNQGIELYGVDSLNRQAIVKDPAGLVITKNAGFISQFDNAIAFAGTEGRVTYRGYKADLPTYFDGAFTNPSDTYIPTTGTVPVVVSTDMTFELENDLLTNSPFSESVGHRIAQVTGRDLNFAEIVIEGLDSMQTFGTSKLKQLLLSLGGVPIKEIECILHFTGTGAISRKIVPDDAEYLRGNLFNLFGYRYDTNKDEELEMVIIRLIGQHGTSDLNTQVRDIALETSEAWNKPNINIGGDQTIYGQHSIAEQLGADEYRYTDKPSPAGDGGGYGNEVLQLKKNADGAIGLYNLNSNDDSIEGLNSSGPNILLSAEAEVDLDCSISTSNFTTTQPLTSENGTIDVIYRIVNAGANNVRFNSTTYITRLFADGVKVGEVTKLVRGTEKIESISFPVTSSFASGVIFSVTVESDKDGPQIGNASFATRLRLTKSFLVPRPSAKVANANTGSPTAALNAATINDLLQKLRDAGFITPP